MTAMHKLFDTVIMSFSVIIAVLVAMIISLSIGYWLFIGRREKRKHPARRKDRNTILREANRQLAQNPRDHKALQALADLYYDEKTWDKALKTYGILMNLSATVNEIDEAEVTMRYGLAAMQLKNYDEAYKALTIARSLRAGSFEIDNNLGQLEYRRGNYEKAIGLLKPAFEAMPDHLPTQRYLGRSLHSIKHYKESIRFLKRVVDAEPDDKGSLFLLAQAYGETGQNERSLALYSHLRADPKMGPHAALSAGATNLSRRDLDRAIIDFELGLRHQNIPKNVLHELQYRLADAYTHKQEIGRALDLLVEIHKTNPGYRDVAPRIARNKELNSNKNLQIYLIAPKSEFVSLCRRAVTRFFDNSKVKIVNVQMVKNEYADILTEVETNKWEDVILFRFIRSTGNVGELIVRELNSRLKETRSGRGFCITAGEFSETAESFVEARLIDLLDKSKLLKVLGKLK